MSHEYRLRERRKIVRIGPIQLRPSVSALVQFHLPFYDGMHA